MAILHILLPYSPLVQTWDTHGLGPTNSWVKSVDLHVHLVRFIVSQNHMVIGKLARPIYMQVSKHVRLYRA